jgi:hypothetical protein
LRENVILREHILIQNPFIQLEDKSLQCSENVKAMGNKKWWNGMTHNNVLARIQENNFHSEDRWQEIK